MEGAQGKGEGIRRENKEEKAEGKERINGGEEGRGEVGIVFLVLLRMCWQYVDCAWLVGSG